MRDLKVMLVSASHTYIYIVCPRTCGSYVIRSGLVSCRFALPPLCSPANDRFINLLPLLLSSPPFYSPWLSQAPSLLAPRSSLLRRAAVIGIDRFVAPLSAGLRPNNFTRGRLGSPLRDLTMGGGSLI